MGKESEEVFRREMVYTSGQSFGHCYSIDWQKRFQPCESLLNPDKATLAELWGNQGEVSYESYMGNSSATKDTRYNRYAVIAWPLTENIGRARQYIGEDAAIAALAGGPVNFAALQSFMADTIAKASGYWRPSVVFGESMIKMLVDWSGEDYELANLFIEKLFARFRAEVKLAPPFGSFFSAFGWAKIGVSVTQAIASMPKDNEALKFALALAECTKTGCIVAYRLFLDFSVKVARSIRASELTKDSEILKALWKATIDDADERSFLEWSTYVQQIDPSMLGAFVDSSKSFMVLGVQSDANTVKTEFSTSTTLLRLARLRLDWINTQRSKGETWEMLMAIYARDRRVEAFLRGPEQTMTLNEFQNAKHATNYSRKHSRDQENASFTMKNQARTVIITKTREYFIQQQASGEYDQESRDLSRLCGVEFVDFATAPPPSKRVKRSNTARITMPPSGMSNASFPSASSIPPYQGSAALARRTIVSHPIRTLELSQEPPQMGDNAFLSSHPLHSSIQHQPNQLTRPLYPSALARHNYGDPLPSVPQHLINGQPVSASSPLWIRLPRRNNL